MSEAANLFSTKERDYAFGETDDDGNRNLASFAAERPERVSASCQSRIDSIG
jgi:hypothetical protein